MSNYWDKIDKEFLSNWQFSEKHLNDESFNWLIDFIKTSDVESILDVGCGAGALLYKIIQANIHVKYTGIDISKNQIDIAQKAFNEFKDSFHHIDSIENWSEKVDVVVLRHVLAHQDTLEQMQTLLSKSVQLSNKYLVIIFHLNPGSEKILYRASKQWGNAIEQNWTHKELEEPIYSNVPSAKIDKIELPYSGKNKKKDKEIIWLITLQ